MSPWPGWVGLDGLSWLAHIEWAQPWLALLWPLALLLPLLPPHRHSQTALRIPFFALAVAATGESPRPGATVLPHGIAGWMLLGLAWTAGILAVMQPQWVEPPLPRAQPTRDWLLAIDLSPSMRARDFRDAQGHSVDRLTVIRDVLDDFLERRPEDRIGLLLFAEQAYVQAPFTLDHGAVRALLAEARIGMAGSRTMIGDAIGLAVRVFDASPAPQRTLVLLTDGADTGSRVPPAKAAEIAAQRGVRIHTVAIGTEDAPAGERPDLEGLRAWATLTGGRAFSAVDRSSLKDIYRELDALETHEHETQSVRPRRPLFHWPVAAALTLLGVYLLRGVLGGTLRAGFSGTLGRPTRQRDSADVEADHG